MGWRLEWQESAECLKVDGEVLECFFPDSEVDPPEVVERQELIAQLVCSSCAVVEECLAYALETHETFGVWGMHTQADRRNLRRWLSRYPDRVEHHWALSFKNILLRLDSALDAETAQCPTVTPVHLGNGHVKNEALVVNGSKLAG
jgi:WhiB family redox-sensing transcriptional regulator